MVGEILLARNADGSGETDIRVALDASLCLTAQTIMDFYFPHLDGAGVEVFGGSGLALQQLISK